MSGRGRRRAAVTGLGAVSGFGPGVERLFTSLAEGQRAVRHWPTLEAAGLPATVSVVPGEDPLSPGDRAVRYALQAAAEAVADAGGVVGGERLSVVAGTTLGAIGDWLEVVRGRPASDPDPASTWARPARAIAAAWGARGAALAPSVACASGNAALGAALEEVRSGRAVQVVAGGVDAIHEFVLAGFAALKAADTAPCRPFDRNRAGLNLGEGAAFLVIEDEEHARARGARIRAFLDGYGEAADAHHMTGPDPEGRGAARAMRAALTDAGLAPEAVDFVNAHGTATVFNDLMESKALRLVFGARAASLPVNSIKGAIGHTLGAAGALEAVVCVRSLEAGMVVPTVGPEEIDPGIQLDIVRGAARKVPLGSALSGSSGFGGTNAAIALRAAS